MIVAPIMKVPTTPMINRAAKVTVIPVKIKTSARIKTKSDLEPGGEIKSRKHQENITIGSSYQ